MDELELTLTKVIAAPRDKVFAAWLSPDLLAKFMRTPSGQGANARVSNDPVKGGQFSIVMIADDREIPHHGTYLVIDPHSHLSFTWVSPHSLDDSVVTIDFADAGPGQTAITLRQVKFRSEQARNGHIGGWTTIIGYLDDMIAHSHA